MTAFALDNVSPRGFFSGLSHRGRRADMMTDVYSDMSVKRGVSGRVDSIDSERWNEQPDASYGETLELGTRGKELGQNEPSTVLDTRNQ
jgi:hypothetical protein